MDPRLADNSFHAKVRLITNVNNENTFCLRVCVQ